MAAISANDAILRAMRALGLSGSPRYGALSRKYNVGGSPVEILFPLLDGKRPNYLKIHTAGTVYGDFIGAAAVPTTGADGSERFNDGDEIALWHQDRISLVAEAASVVTLSYVWTTT